MAATQWNLLLQQIRRLSGSARDQDSDEQLLERFHGCRDEAAFTALVRRHGAMVFGVCRRVLHQEQDAEDAFQATFLLLARKAASLRPQRSLGGWLHQVAYHLALRARENAARRQRTENEVRTMMPSEEPDREVCRRELRSLLDEELGRLPAKYREPLILCYLEGKTNEQAARQLGWPIGSMSRRLTRGRELLRRRLLHRGVTMPVGMLAAALIEESATAAVPPLLLASTARMALNTPALGVPASVAALVEGGMREIVLFKARITLFLLLATIGLGVGALGYQIKGKEATDLQSAPIPAEANSQPLGKLPIEEQSALPSNATHKPPHSDWYGDPLPPGAMARLGTIRLRHLSATVTFSQDGKTLISAGADGTIRYWEPDSGKELRRVSVQRQAADTRVHPQIFSADGRIVAGLASQTICVWEAQTGEELQRIPLGKVPFPGLEHIPIQVYRLALSPNGNVLAAVLYDLKDRNIHLWDAATGKKLFILKTRQASNDLAFSADGKLLATVAFDGFLRLWDTTTGKEIRKIAGASNYLALSPDGKRVAADSRTGTKVWNVADGKEVLRIESSPGRYPGPPTFAPDNKTLAVCFLKDLGELELYDIASGKKLRTIPKCSGRLAFSPDGKTAATSGTAIHIWDVTTGKEVGLRAGNGSAVTSLAIAPDGGRVATFDTGPFFRVWDAASGQPHLEVAGHKYVVTSGAFSPDGRFLYTGGGDDNLRCWDCQTGAEVRNFPIESRKSAEGGNWIVRAMSLSTEGERLAAVVTSRHVHVWETATGKRLAGRPLKALSLEPHISPDGRSMTNEGSGAVVVADTVTGKEIVKAKGGAPLAYSPDGQILAMAHFKPNPRPTGMMGSGYLTPDDVDAIWLMELATGKQLLRIETGPVGHNALAYSPDGRMLATADRDSFRLWDAATGRQVFRRLLPEKGIMPGNSSFATFLAFLPRGDRLATGLMDGTTLIWDLEPKTWRAGLGVKTLASRDLVRLWAELAGEDAAKAYRAEWTLAAVPDRAVPFLKDRLRPVSALDAKQVQSLIADLNSGEFAVRDAAEKRLASFGEQVEPALRIALEGKPSLEARKRLEALHTDAELAGQSIVHSAELLRTLRAIRVLEHIGDVEAQRVLQKLAGGDTAARVTRQAKAALLCVQHRTAKR